VSELDSLRSVYEPLAQSVRRLIDFSIRSEADAETVAEAKALIDDAADRLSPSLVPGSFGVRQLASGEVTAWGNVVIGIRNPVAPPLVIHHNADGSVSTEFTLGAPYEGPPGHVHGGVCAMVLDHVLGATAHRPGNPAYTGTLTMRYLRGTLLGPLTAHAHIDRVEGVKTFAVGHIADAEGATVEAEGIFIRPNRPRA
jgi:acyl-coenzyme A thioesterase PaaI-like protein